MKKALIVVDCLRYNHSKHLQFDGFKKLTKCVSVSNWTMPVIATMITGLHPTQHRCCLYPTKDKNVQYLNALQKDSYHSLEESNLMQKYNHKTVLEIPVLRTLGDYTTYSAKKEKDGEFPGISAVENKWFKGGANFPDFFDFLYLHLKGAHSPYSYLSKMESTYANQEKEVERLSERLEPFVERLKRYFDKIVIASDHGHIWQGVDKTKVNRGHGWEFHKNNLHIPIWVYNRYGTNNISVDKLYDTRVVYNFLEYKEWMHIPSQHMVLSTTPGYGKYNRYAISYLKDGKIYTEPKQTERYFDLK